VAALSTHAGPSSEKLIFLPIRPTKVG
jgi:hypothetical protein